MLLQRCIRSLRFAVALGALLLLAACAGSGGPRAEKSVQNGDTEQTGLAVPPAIANLFEQAASAMAAGDFVDAELRFKEFLSTIS